MTNAQQIADLANNNVSTQFNVFSVFDMCKRSAPRQRQLENGWLFTLNDGSMILWRSDDDWDILTAVRVDSKNENLIDADGNVRFVRNEWNQLTEVMSVEEITDALDAADDEPELAVLEALQDALVPHIMAAKNIVELHNLLTIQGDIIRAASGEDKDHLGVAFGSIACDLPTFGDNEPSDTDGIWSYDDTQCITGEGWGEWTLEARSDLTVECVRAGDDDDGNIVVKVPKWGLSFAFTPDGEVLNGIEFIKWFAEEGMAVYEWAEQASVGETEDFLIDQDA